MPYGYIHYILVHIKFVPYNNYHYRENLAYWLKKRSKIIIIFYPILYFFDTKVVCRFLLNNCGVLHLECSIKLFLFQNDGEGASLGINICFTT